MCERFKAAVCFSGMRRRANGADTYGPAALSTAYNQCHASTKQEVFRTVTTDDLLAEPLDDSLAIMRERDIAYASLTGRISFGSDACFESKVMRTCCPDSDHCGR